MDAAEQRRLIEALILAAPEPISLARLAQIVPDCTPGVAKDRINELNTEYQEQDRSFEIWEVAGGYQIRTRAEFSGYLQQLRKERPLRLSHAALESLAIIAYKQPATRGELEAVRGVDTGAVLKGLLERRLIRILGHKEVPGRPLLYGTSKRFLEVFGLESLKKLPSLRELEELAREQGVELPGADALEEASAEAPGSLQQGDATPDAQEGATVSDAEVEADLAPGATPVPDAANGEVADADADAERPS
jgi:segregation and condensation protein B